MSFDVTEQPQIVFMLEEGSAEIVIDCLMKKFFPSVNSICIPHNGKNDLQRSIPRKLKRWNNPHAHFVIVHDQDDKDCHQLKKELRGICESTPRSDAIIRIVCKTLEAWYWGDLDAVAQAYPKFKPERVKDKKRNRIPDSIGDPYGRLKDVLKKHCGEHTECGKMQMAERIAPHMCIDNNNKSESFNVFIKSVDTIVECL